MKNGRVFGPVPSRRLGRSMGINNIPPKICSYSCAYCQVGRSLRLSVTRESFYDPEELLEETHLKIRKALEKGEKIDYLSIVPDGEPTLDINLGRLIDLLKCTGHKVAVITNSSLLTIPEVRNDLGNADWVSVKLDTAGEEKWRRINRPHTALHFDEVLRGIMAFAASFRGELATETMLVKGLNDTVREMEELAVHLRGVNPAVAWLSVPTRPPAEKWVESPDEATVISAYQVLLQHGLPVELLVGYEGNAFAYTGNIGEDILSITAVHPMREEAVYAYLQKAQGKFSTVMELVKSGELIVSDYRGERFFVRKFRRLQR